MQSFRHHPLQVYFFIFQGSVQSPRGSDLGDHIAAVKPNGGHVSYSEISASTLNGKTSSEEFEHIIHTMAQV